MSFRCCEILPSLYMHDETRIRMAAHIDDPMAIGVLQDVYNMYNALGNYVSVRVGEQFGPKPSKYLGLLYQKFGSKFIEKPATGYIKEMTKTIGVDKCKPADTPGIRRDMKNEKPEDNQYAGPENHTIFRSGVGKGQFIKQTFPQTAFATKELSKVLHEG